MRLLYLFYSTSFLYNQYSSCCASLRFYRPALIISAVSMLYGML